MSSGAVAESSSSGGTRPGHRPTEHPHSQDRLTVLVVEQQSDVVRGLVEALGGQPIAVEASDDAAEALLVLGRTGADVVLLGPVRGRLDAVDFIRVVRSDDPDLPILAGAGPSTSEFAAGATAAGATAVIPRPYRGAELLALLRSLVPRAARMRLRPLPIDLGRLRIDGAAPQLWVDGRHVALPPMEFVLLRYFAARVGEVISRAELSEALWGDAGQAHNNTLTVHIMRLRRRLGGDDAEWIRAVRGLGYQFMVPGEDTGGPTLPGPR